MTKAIKIGLIILTIVIAAQAEIGFHLIGTMTGLNDGDRYMEVQGIGDINADGYKDFAIGANWCTVADGYVDIYLGGATIDIIPDYHLTEEEYTYFGNSITSGDFNNDGVSDIVISDYGYSYYSYMAGRVFIFWGGADFDTIPDLIIECHNYMYMFGWEVENGGDVNGDGADDLLIGAPDDYTTMGYVIIYYGGSNMDAEADVVFQGGMCDMIGKAICGMGDISGDGYDDMLIGTHYQSATETYGKTYLMYGGDSIGAHFDTIYESDTTISDFGFYVENLGDISGDTISEYAILSLKHIHIFSGKNIEEFSDFGKGELNCDFFSICNPVDINNDSINDVIIGTVGWQGNNLGAYIYLGGTDFDSIPDYIIQSEKYEDGLGYTIASIGDINNDGQQELLIGGMGSNERGIVCLYTFGEYEDITTEAKTTAEDFKLYQNYPNPFNANTQIGYYLPVASNINITINNQLGQKIKTLITGEQPSGYHLIEWDGTNQYEQPVSSGVYFYNLSYSSNITQKTTQIMKLIFIK